MSEIRVLCPMCRQELEAPDDMMGTVVECPQCRQKFRLPVAQRPVPREPENQGRPQKRIVLNGHIKGSLASYKQDRPCPYCGEIISRATDKCIHCGSRVTPLRELGKQYEGVSRLGFWVVQIVVGFVLGFVIGGLWMTGNLAMDPRISSSEQAGGIALFGLGIGSFWLVFILWLVVNRLRNMGYSGWHALFCFVPIVNWGIGLMCACFPEGYRDKRKLDTTGWVLIPVFILQAIPGVIFMIWALGSMLS